MTATTRTSTTCTSAPPTCASARRPVWTSGCRSTTRSRSGTSRWPRLLQTVNPRSPDYIQLVGSTLGGHLPFVVWMRLDAEGVVHTHVTVRAPLGWHDREVAAGLRVRDMERVDPVTWRVYTTSSDPAVTAVATYTLTAGVLWRPEATIPTPRAVQRVEVVDGYRDPARVILTGASSARPADVADGDIYVAGAPPRPRG